MDNMHKACIVCKDKDISMKYIVNGFHIFQCRGCSLLFVGEKLSREELKTYYEKESTATEDYTYIDSKNIENLKFSYVKLADLISKRIPTGKILDVGCSGGYFLDCMQGWECYGIELVSSYAQKAKAKYGNNIYIGTLEDYECTPEYFDVITLQNVLDHMPDPLQALNKCNVLLRPNGLIVVKVHDFLCLFGKLMGPKFYALIPPEHLVYFNKKNLTRALMLCGFEVEEYMYLVELLFLKIISYRLSQKTKGTFFYRIFQRLNHSTLGNIKIKKNLHDIITVFARKAEA
jgi:SAM-dependent methyltransferase